MSTVEFKAKNGQLLHGDLLRWSAINMKDRHGNVVELGDIVRVVEICQEFLDVLSDNELVHISKMLNQEYPIDDFPEQGKASVSISWEIESGLTGHGGLYMLPHEFELVRKARSEAN